MNTKQIITIILVGLASIIASFFLGRCTTPEPEETIITKSDTIYTHSIDTIFVEKPKLITSVILDTIYVPRDTFLVSESKTYEDSLSTIWISGIDAELDSVRYYIPKDTILINTEITKTIVERKHWGQFIGVGVTLGASAGYNPMFKQPVWGAPTISVGLTYGWGYNW